MTNVVVVAAKQGEPGDGPGGRLRYGVVVAHAHAAARLDAGRVLLGRRSRLRERGAGRRRRRGGRIADDGALEAGRAAHLWRRPIRPPSIRTVPRSRCWRRAARRPRRRRRSCSSSRPSGRRSSPATASTPWRRPACPRTRSPCCGASRFTPTRSPCWCRAPARFRACRRPTRSWWACRGRSIRRPCPRSSPAGSPGRSWWWT